MDIRVISTGEPDAAALRSVGAVLLAVMARLDGEAEGESTVTPVVLSAEMVAPTNVGDRRRVGP
jgi:hypothetical protein